jgi:diacylglycerol kinase (ATP)
MCRLRRVLRQHRDLASITPSCTSVGTVTEAMTAIEDLDSDVVPVAVGGDGTINLVAQALLATAPDLPLGVVPLGTGNAFAHSLGLGSVDRALAALTSGQPRPVDLMRTSHPRAPIALVSVSVGFEAALLRSWARKRRVVGLAAGLGLWTEAIGRRRGVLLTLDGVPALAREQWFYNVGLYSTRCYAFGHRVFPCADPSDGRAEMCLSRTAGEYWGGLLLRRWGPSTWSTALLRSDESMQVDGEPVEAGELEVQVIARSLRVLSNDPGAGTTGLRVR